MSGDVQGYFESLWNLEAEHRPLRFGEKDTKASLLDLGTRMLAVLCEQHDPTTRVLAVEQPFAVPLIDPETGEVLDRDLVGSLDRLERDLEGCLVVVDLKTAARRYTNLDVEASLQLSVYSYATMMNGLGDQEDLRLRFDVLTKTKTPSSTATGRRGTAGRRGGSTGWRARSSRRSRSGCSRRGWGGSAGSVRFGVDAGCGGEVVSDRSRRRTVGPSVWQPRRRRAPSTGILDAIQRAGA
jgi:hypothetical protein